MKYPEPEGRTHNIIRDRARYLRIYNGFAPSYSFDLALREWREHRLLNVRVQPKTGLPFVYNREDGYYNLAVTLKGNHHD